MYDIQTITDAVAQLSPADMHKLFLLLSEHADLLEKIVPGLPMVWHVMGKQILEHPLAETYNAWLNAEAGPAPTS